MLVVVAKINCDGVGLVVFPHPPAMVLSTRIKENKSNDLRTSSPPVPLCMFVHNEYVTIPLLLKKDSHVALCSPMHNDSTTVQCYRQE